MDGTLLGRRASLFHDADGAFTMLGARALEACARADVEVVPYSGRRQSTLLHNAVLLGVRSYIFEAGCGMVLDGEVVTARGGDRRRGGERAAARAVPARDVRPVEPGARVVSALPRAGRRRRGSRRTAHRGRVRGVPARRQRGDARRCGRRRAYHLVPREASKARAVARHMQARGFVPEEVIAVGDSMEDLGSASVVGTFWLVANAEPEVHDAARGMRERAGSPRARTARASTRRSSRSSPSGARVRSDSVLSLRREPANGGW